MGWLGRLIDGVSRRIRGAGPTPVPGGLRYPTGVTLEFSALVKAYAFRHVGFVGEDLGLGLEFGGGRLVLLAEGDLAWRQTVEALDADPRVTTKSPEWTVALIATGGEEKLVNLLSAPTSEPT